MEKEFGGTCEFSNSINLCLESKLDILESFGMT